MTTNSIAPYDPNELVLIVAARVAWPLYQQHATYLCQNNRFFQDTKRMGFYSDRVIYPAFPLILSRRDDVEVTPRSSAALSLGLDPDGQRQGRKLRGIIASGWDNEILQMTELTAADDPRTLSREEPIPHTGTSGWTMGHRYARLGELLTASSTDELT